MYSHQRLPAGARSRRRTRGWGAGMNRSRWARGVALGTVMTVAVLAPQSAHAAPAPAKYDWPQFAYDPGKSANDTAETTVTLANVKNLKQLFKVSLPDAPDGAPVYLHDVTTPKGVKDVVYVQGEHGHLIAKDAHTGATIWSDTFGPGG